MFTSILAYPRRDNFIRIHASILRACKKNSCAAALLTLLTEAGEPVRYEDNVLLAELMIFTGPQVAKAITLLCDLGFLEVAPGADGTNYHVLTDNVNRLLIEYDAEFNGEPDAFEPPKPKPKKSQPESSPQAIGAITVLEYRNRRRSEYWALRGRKVTGTKPDSALLVYITDLLTAGYTVEQLCLAVEGNLLSDWHQGMNDRQTVYDGIDFIFKDRGRLNRFITDAERAGAEVSGAPDSKPRDAYDYMKAVELLLPVALDESTDVDYIVRQFKVLYPKIDLNRLSGVLRPEIEGRAGMYAEVHRQRLLVFADKLKTNE